MNRQMIQRASVAAFVTFAGTTWAGDAPEKPAAPTKTAPSPAAEDVKNAREALREAKGHLKESEAADRKDKEHPHEGAEHEKGGEKEAGDKAEGERRDDKDHGGPNDALAAARRDLREAKGDLKESRKLALETYKKVRMTILEAEKAEREALKAIESGKGTKAEREVLVAAAREAARAARKANLEQLLKAKGSLEAASEGLRLSDAERAELKARTEKLEQKRKETRAERATARRAELKEKLGKKADSEENQTELRRHAWRVARLTQLALLAEARNQTELKARAEKLLQEENDRFSVKIAAISGEKGAAK